MLNIVHKSNLAMRMTLMLPIAMLMAIIPSSARAYTFADVEVACWSGVAPEEGVNESLLVVDWQVEGAESMVFGYRWMGEATGSNMLNAIHQADNRFYFEWHWMYNIAIYGIGWDADGDGFDKTDPDDYYEEGFENDGDGYWSYYLGSDGENWAYSGLPVVGRTLSDGSWDGWSWSPNFVSSAPDNIPLAAAGDSNGDGVVDELDYENLMSQFGGAPGAVDSSDFNGDNFVDLEDFAILRGNFGSGLVSAPDAEFGAPAPEPASMVIGTAGGAVLLARRRRRRTCDLP